MHGAKRKNRREETVLTRMRKGHTRLNKTLFLIEKSGTDGCECGKTERTCGTHGQDYLK